MKSDDVLATRKPDGSLVLAVWNYAPPGQSTDTPQTITLDFKHVNATRASVSRVDAEHGDMHAAYAAMGSPRYPTQAQLKQLRAAAALPPPEEVAIDHGKLSITLPSHGLAVIEVR